MEQALHPLHPAIIQTVRLQPVFHHLCSGMTMNRNPVINATSDRSGPPNTSRPQENAAGNQNITYVDFYLHKPPVAAVFTVSYLLIFLVCMVGNSVVCFVVLRCKNMRTVTNLFILNLAISDLLVGIFCMPTTLLDNIITGWCIHPKVSVLPFRLTLMLSFLTGQLFLDIYKITIWTSIKKKVADKCGHLGSLLLGSFMKGAVASVGYEFCSLCTV